MPDMAPVSGAPPVAPAIPVVGLLAPAVQPGLAAGITISGDPIDPVSLSPAARLQQARAVPDAVMQQLGSLLAEVEQITQLTSRVAPLVMGELAAEIGTAANELGAGVQALLPPPGEVPTPLQLAATATLRVLGTLAPALRQAGDRSLNLAPAVQAWREMLPGDLREIRPTDTVAVAAAAQPNPEGASIQHPAASARQTVPAAGDLPATGSTTEGDLPTADAAGPDRGMSPVDPGREAQVAARAILRSATDTLGRIQLDLDAAAAPAAAVHGATAAQASGPGHDRAWCEAQIVLAQAQVARASRAIESQLPAAPRWHRAAARLGQRSSRSATAVSRHRLLLVRAGALLALLCIAATTVWAASRLDLILDPIAAAMLLALVGLAWTWCRRASWRRSRLRIELRR